MRHAIITSLALTILSSAAFAADTAPATQAAATQPGPFLTADESKQVDAMIASFIAAGFPDTQKATVYIGTIGVRAQFDPAKQAMQLPSEASNTQQTISNSSEVIYGYKFDGLHFKLPDGSWIIGMSYHFVPGKDDAVSVADAKEVNLATLTADAMKAHPFDAAKTTAKYLSLIKPEQRDRSARAMNELVAVSQQLHIEGDEFASAAVMLRRAGWEQAGDMAIAVADIRARSYWQMKPWTDPESAFDPMGKYPSAKDEEAAWVKAHPVFESEPPAVALRRAMFRIMRAQIMIEDRENALVPVDVAAALAKASLDDKDPQKFGGKIDGLVAGAKLPVSPGEKADLAARLQSWEAGARRPKMVVSSPGNGLSMSTAFVAPEAAYTPAKGDLDGLVALLGDERPSRFFDFSGPRTLGDNAWRGLAALLKSDPRALAGYPTDHPWTKEERQTAAKAVQKWWAAHREEFVGK